MNDIHLRKLEKQTLCGIPIKWPKSDVSWFWHYQDNLCWINCETCLLLSLTVPRMTSQDYSDMTIWSLYGPPKDAET